MVDEKCYTIKNVFRSELCKKAEKLKKPRKETMKETQKNQGKKKIRQKENKAKQSIKEIC